MRSEATYVADDQDRCHEQEQVLLSSSWTASSALDTYTTGAKPALETNENRAEYQQPLNNQPAMAITARQRSEDTAKEAFLPIEISRSDSLADLTQPLSPKAQVEHVTSEVVLIVRLAIRLWSYLGLGTILTHPAANRDGGCLGWRWTWNCLRLVVYALILMPGFIQMVFYYFFSQQVLRSVIYGRRPRNRLDLYFPTTPCSEQSKWPVVVFITGGAWTIGYKAWGALLGRRLSENGILVASLDYRNFPQGSCPDMLEDINVGISWVLRRIHEYGGDPNAVYLCGQSAGGHLAAVAMLTQVERMLFGESHLTRGGSWDPLSLKGFVGVSGAYSLPDLADHLDKRGLYKSMFRSIMSIDGETRLETLSPIHIAQRLKSNLSQHLPEVLLLHGKLDKSVPYAAAEKFEALLKESGVQCRCKIYDGKSHTQPLIEDPLKGGRDCLMEDILRIVLDKEQYSNQRALVPVFLTDLASLVCPF